ncbi:histidinol-phosphate aminotransferase [Nitritalea halalkaliphila LW7]|uniref:Histidinol-phosphate aminotransferase n=1 Tax=Nitritalea halalkaliphila LW7 TaxID=1189621 RepID=I5C9T0_9BACT|nr:histidinol-phosphate transaminase [Nitritalea halalkaliphila]EIM78582.1 histidinol-phosphate aminotransferase [Nitritalea halalkaliphila LW7]
MEVTALLRPHIAKLSPYSSARDEYSGKEGIFLDANENPFGDWVDGKYHRYPDPYQQAIKEKLSALKGIPAQRIFLGNGSDEAIDLLIRAFCEPNRDEVLLLPPTYGMYEVSAGINAVGIRRVPLTSDFQPDVAAIQAAVRPETKMLFLCSPNNPSGNKMERSALRQLIREFPGIVVVDEAYIDFSDEPSFITELDDFPNLVVIQTFSKAWGLANLRVGMAFSSEALIRVLNLIKPPYNISGLTQEKVLQALEQAEQLDGHVKSLLAERAFLEKALERSEFVEKVFPSHANFILCKLPHARAVYEGLLKQFIIVRDRSKVLLCADCLRISVGTREENEAFLAAFEQVAGTLAAEKL